MDFIISTADFESDRACKDHINLHYKDNSLPLFVQFTFPGGDADMAKGMFLHVAYIPNVTELTIIFSTDATFEFESNLTAFKKLTQLNIRGHSRLSWYRRLTCQPLEHLDLNNCTITSFEDTALKCPHLKEITLNDCRLPAECMNGTISKLNVENSDTQVSFRAPELKILNITNCRNICLASTTKLSNLTYVDDLGECYESLEICTLLPNMKKVDLCINANGKDMLKVFSLLQKLRHVKFLSLNWSLVKSLSSSIANGDQSFLLFNLKTLRMYSPYEDDHMCILSPDANEDDSEVILSPDANEDDSELVSKEPFYEWIVTQMNKRNFFEDFPDDTIFDLFSLVGTEQAMDTYELSSRWLDKWTETPKFNFTPKLNKRIERPVNIDTTSISFSLTHEAFPETKRRMLLILEGQSRSRKLKQLEITYLSSKWKENESLEIPELDLNSLKTLTLSSGQSVYGIKYYITTPSSWLIPTLVTLYLNGVMICLDEAKKEEVFSGITNLRNLTMVRCRCDEKLVIELPLLESLEVQDCLCSIEVNAPMVKRLIIEDCQSIKVRNQLNCLENFLLRVGDLDHIEFSDYKDPPNLNQVGIYVFRRNKDINRVKGLLKLIFSVKRLTINSAFLEVIQCLFKESGEQFVFPKLECITISRVYEDLIVERGLSTEDMYKLVKELFDLSPDMNLVMEDTKDIQDKQYLLEAYQLIRNLYLSIHPDETKSLEEETTESLEEETTEARVKNTLERMKKKSKELNKMEKKRKDIIAISSATDNVIEKVGDHNQKAVILKGKLREALNTLLGESLD